MISESTRDFFARMAPHMDKWQKKNAYYHDSLRILIQGIVPPGRHVLEVGCRTGDLLESLKPLRGIGLNFSEELTTIAKSKHPSLEFYSNPIPKAAMTIDFKPDFIILSNMLDYAYDVADLLEQLKPFVAEKTVVVIVTNNPLWAPILRLGSRVGLRIPESHRNFMTNKDLGNILHSQNYDVVEDGLALPFPIHVPLVSAAMNAVIPDLPLLRYLSSVQYIVARPKEKRLPLSCSVVIPCHNEEDNITDCIKRIPDMGTKTEIIVVDDGSTDKTREKTNKAMEADSRVRLLAFDKNQGKANAVFAGFYTAQGDILMILDADMTVLPEDLPRFCHLLQHGLADFVNGTRLIYPMEGRAMRLHNFLGNKAFCFLVSWILHQRISDTLCGTKAFLRRDLTFMPHKKQERWGDFELLFGAARLKLRIMEMPIHYHERRAGKSKMRVLYDGLLFLKSCFYGWLMLRFPKKFPWETYEIDKAAEIPR